MYKAQTDYLLRYDGGSVGAFVGPIKRTNVRELERGKG